MQDLIRHLPAVIFAYAIYPNGDEWFQYVSDGAAKILGLKPEAIVEDRDVFFSIAHQEDALALQASLRERSARSHSWRWQGRVHVLDDIRWMEIRSEDEVTKDGVIMRRGIIQDIPPGTVTHPEKAVDYGLLWEKLPIGVVIHQEGKIRFANAHAHHLIGTTPGALKGMNAMDFVHPDYKADISRRIKHVVKGAPVPMIEEKFIRFDGEVIEVETLAFPFSYNGAAAVQVIFRDITEKKKIEAQMRRNDTLFSQLFHNLPMAVVMLDETGKVIQVNKGFEKVFGYQQEELQGKNLNDFIVPAHLRNEGVDLNNLIASNQVISIESIRLHRSGKPVNVILCGVPVMLDQETIGIYGVYIDISDRKKIEEELQIRNTELDNFVYKVSHDLRAPLSSVLGLVNLSQLHGNTDNPQEYISIIGEKIEALDHFIGDVLSHSKNLKMEINIGQVDLEKIIEQTFKDLGYLNGAMEMKLSVKAEGIDFYSDHWRVSEIFRNLISNAIKYRQADAKESEIDIRIKVDHLCAEIHFGDNGIGINEASLKRVFEMFYRATQQSDGSGIGLYIVKNAVEKLGGQINIASSPGVGTRFHILLPNRIKNILQTRNLEANQQ